MRKGFKQASVKRKIIFVASVVLAITAVHMIMSFIIMDVVDDNWGEQAVDITRRHLEEQYAGYRVESSAHGFSMFGVTPLGWGGLAMPFMFFALPYQALSMELYHRGLSLRWLFPYWVGIHYAVYDQDGQLIKDALKGFYVYSRNRVIWMEGLEGG
ncbi:MAG: hypothetical protein AB1445_01280 [Bacillota bacterium]